jgi:hypothetical protein
MASAEWVPISSRFGRSNKNLRTAGAKVALTSGWEMVRRAIDVPARRIRSYGVDADGRARLRDLQ